MGIDSLRAEITLFEAARARAVADGRHKASTKDIRAVAPIAIRLRRSEFMEDFFKAQRREQRRLQKLLLQPASGKKPRAKS
jgi:magnesium chelatase subunit I